MTHLLHLQQQYTSVPFAFGKQRSRMPLCGIKRAVASSLPTTTLQVALGTPANLTLHAVEGYRHFKSPPCLSTRRAYKMAATYSPTTCSTIGVAELNDPVRNGKGWDLSAITTLIKICDFYDSKIQIFKN